jgi:hypothetical protein
MVAETPTVLSDSCTIDGLTGSDFNISGLSTGRTLSFTNTPVGAKGTLWLNNPSGRTITKGSGIVCEASTFATISAAGYYRVDYWHIGSGSVLVTASGTLS